MLQGRRNLPENMDEFLHQGFRYALSLCHNESTAEDIVQDACMKMLHSKKEWRKQYFFSIIRNHFIDLYRRSKRVRISSLEESDGQKQPLSWSVNATAEKDLASAQEMDDLLGRLSPEQREAIYLSVVEGYTAKEISQLTHTPANTVLSHVHRARRKLITLLGKKNENKSAKHPYSHFRFIIYYSYLKFSFPTSS